MVERDDGSDGYLIIDGQHRFLAAQELGLRRLPVVVVPRDVARRMLTLNVEKEPNIRDRSAVALSIYREMVEIEPKMLEDDAEVADAVQHAHYVTLGLAYAASGGSPAVSTSPSSGSATGSWTDRSRSASRPREERAAKVVEAHRLVRAVSDRLKEIGCLARVRRRADRGVSRTHSGGHASSTRSTTPSTR